MDRKTDIDRVSEGSRGKREVRGRGNIYDLSVGRLN